MTEFMKKAIVILVLMLMLINSSLLSVISIAIEDSRPDEENIDETKINPLYEINLEKYVNYKIEENSGTLVQMDLKTGIEYLDGQEYKPLNSTGVLLNLPKIENEFPESIEVIGKSTKATNGSDVAKDFQYVYDKNTGEMKIVAINHEDKDGNIYTEKVDGARDEYTVICYYSANCYNDKNVERNLEFSGFVQTNVGNAINKDTEIKQEYNVKENISGLISADVTTSDIYNGYINSNKQNGTQYKTEYTENMKIDVSYKDISDEVKVETNNKFINTKDKEIETDEIVYTGVKVNKQNILDILGEDGKLQILNKLGEVIGEINKDTEAQEDGTVEINYEKEQTDIIVKTTKPVKLGTIELESRKAIKETMTDLNNSKILSAQDIKLINFVEEKDEETQKIINRKEIEVYQSNNRKEIDIKNSQTSVDISLDKNDFTNQISNDVNIMATLVSNNPKFDLFKNPTILISFPSEVEDIILGDVKLLYDDNLSIKSADVVDNNGCKAIKIEINGEQNSYKNYPAGNGPNIMISTTIIIKKEIDSTSSYIRATYTNEIAKSIDYEDEGKESKDFGVTIESVVEMPKVQNYMMAQSVNSETYNLNSLIASSDNNSDLNIEIIAKVGNKVLQSGDTVHEHEIIKYVIKVTNMTSADINNVKIEGNVPEGTTYVELKLNQVEDVEKLHSYEKNQDITKYEQTIEKIEANQTVEKYYEVEVDELDADEKNTESIISVYEKENKIYTYSINNTIIKGDLTARLWVDDITTKDEEYLYSLWIYNNTDKNIENIVATLDIPNGLENTETVLYWPVEDDTEDKKISKIVDGKLIINLDKIDANGKANIMMEFKRTSFEENTYEQNLDVAIGVSYENNSEIYYSNEDSRKSYTEGVQIIQTSEQEGKELNWKDKIEYDVVIKNVGQSKERKDTSIDVLYDIPDGLQLLDVEYDDWKYDEEEQKYIKNIENTSETTADGHVEIISLIPMGEEMHIKITATADIVSDDTEVSNIVVVSGNNIETKMSNIIKCKVLSANDKIEDIPSIIEEDEVLKNDNKPDESNNVTDEDDKDNSTYKINGLVWIDSNKNGKRDENEGKLSNITVKLYNAETNSIVRNSDGGIEILKTNENGEYEFENIKKGKYLVLFEYDTDTYSITEYQKEGVNQSVNSDAIRKEVDIDGEEKKVALTDILSIESSNLDNIDLGLIKNPKFDFSLQKYVSKVKVSNNKENKEYSFNDQKLAKVEVKSKQLKDTTVDIEYKIVVKNEGEIEGYATEIVDYIPDGLTFVSSKNKNWSQSKNNQIVSSELAKTKIAPGESKEITVLLTKNLSEGSIGLFTNGAEISKSSNIDNLMDIDSIENNQSKDEDDYSEAQVLISINTGIVTYTIAVIGLIIILLIIRRLIKNKKININKTSKLFMILIMMSIILIPNTRDIAWTDDEIEELLDKYTHPDTVLDVDYNDISHNWEDEENYVNKGELHCYTGTLALCGSGNHEYKQEKVEITSSSNNRLVDTKSKSIGISDNVQMSMSSKTKNKVGPYKISITDNGVDKNSKLSIESVKGKDVNGNVKSVSVSENISPNTAFYITVPADIVEVSEVKVNISNVKKKRFESIIEITEYWKCVAVDGEHSHMCSVASKAQKLKKVWRKSKKYNRFYDRTVTLGGARLPMGSISINKKDSISSEDLSGTKVHISGPTGFDRVDKDVSISKSGTTINNLPLGEYKIVEIKSPYTLEYQKSSEINKIVTVTENHTSKLNIKNTAYSNLKIIKKDEETMQPLEGVQFKVTRYNPYKNNMKIDEKYYVTDENGEILIEKTETKYKYVVEEVKFMPGSKYEKYYDNVPYQKVLDNLGKDGDTITVELTNPQKYVDISGLVWNDGVEGKDSIRNDLYDSGGDKLTKDVEIKLKNGNGVITNRYGSSCETKGGTYKFESVPIEELEEAYVEFEFNGLRYQAVKVNLDADNGSKADEISGRRQQLNKEFETISGGSTKSSTTIGYSNQNDANRTNILTYESVDSYQSELVQKTGEGPEDSHVSPLGSIGIKMIADTKTTGYTIERYKDGNALGHEIVTNIKNINLGIYERPQTDIALQNDVSKVIVTLNKNGHDYTHIYNYSQRNNYIQKTVDGKVVTEEDEGYNDEMDGYLPAVKVNSNKYNMSYVREIYPSYVNYNKITKNLKIEIVYRIIIANQSSVNVNIDEIVDYYDGNNLTPLFNTIGNNPSGEYSMARVNVNQSIAPKESKEVYLSFEVKNDSINKLLTGDLTIKNVAEISKYSTDDGRIDMDSAPENCNPENVNTYEDDTCGAPPLTLKIGQDDNGLKEKRIRGTVFNDNTESKELRTGMTREGNGKFEEDVEGTVSKVTVELIDTETNADAKLYPNPDNAVDGKIDTESNGYYDFNGLIPGKYILKYTYSDGSVIYTKAGEQEPVRIQDYKSTIIKSDYLKNVIKNNNDKLWYLNNDVVTNKFSVAVDDYQQRKNINDYYSTVSYGLQSDYYASLNRQMIANTADMEVFIEDSECPQGGTEYGKTFVYDYKNVDFGIVERPKESINVTKEISYIRLILANGQVLIEGDPRTESMKYLIYPNGGMLKIEIDNEIIEGAKLEVTYEIKVENNSELDYDNENYYKYGENKSNPVTMTVNKLVDYLDEKLDAPSYSINYKEHDWYRISADDLKTLDLKQDKINISDDVYTAIKDRKEIYVANETEELKNIEPGKSKSIKFNAEKLLTSSNDLTDLTFDNYTEIIQHSNSVGRFYETSGVKATPGNFNINQREQSEIDDNGLDYRRSEITIVPPTGKQAYTIITIIGLASLIIIAGGIIIIKKKIL